MTVNGSIWTLLGQYSDAVYRQYIRALRLWGRLSEKGTPIYEKEWDVLIILDACRVDLLRSVSDEYSFLDNPDTIVSLGSMSEGWLESNFTDAYESELRNTAYVTGNPYSDSALADVELGFLDAVWKYAWDNDIGTIRPRPITDRAISVARDRDPDRMIVHYMQPHYPFIEDPELHPGIDITQFGSLPWENIWEQLRTGEVDLPRVLTAYRNNLKVVLEDVALLRRNVEADTVVISADHGNALGEYGVYGHPPDVPLACLRRVPWYRTSATDTGEYEPTTEYERTEQTAATQRLRELGYIDDD